MIEAFNKDETHRRLPLPISDVRRTNYLKRSIRISHITDSHYQLVMLDILFYYELV